MPRGLARRALWACVLVSVAPVAWGGGQLQAGPTLIELTPGATAGRMTLANTGDAPVAAQIRAFAWSQVGGEDRLGVTHDIALSPAIVQIPAGATQVVRVVRQGPAPTTQDASYRLIVDELPGAVTDTAAGINFRMRYVVPVYVRAAKASSPALQCQLLAAALACDNTGGRAAQLGASRLVDGRGKAVPLTRGLFGYVLAGSRRQWPLDPAQLQPLSAGVRLETQLNGQPLSVPVVRAP